MVALAGTSPASADTAQFKGVNWAVLGDNFVRGPLVLDGLNQSDNYSTVRAKADAIYNGLENQLGVNTVRLPVNTHTVGSSWWNAYRGTIDAATARGFKVILAYWEDGAASGGRITNMSAFNSMWNTITAQYGSDSLVYFEPMNEPHGYSASQWINLAASWINARSSIPRGRILVGGTGYSQDVRPVCADTRLDGTLLSYHHYAFFYGEKDYAGWVQSFRERLGNCASRAILTEFGAPMDTDLNYHNANSSNNFVRYIRADTDSLRALNMGAVYWPALGGKVTAGQNYDWYSMFALHGSGTNLSVSIRNSTGADRLRHGWGDGGPPTEPPGQRYEAESPPAVCRGTIDSDHAGYSGTGFCNGDQAVGAHAQFTVTPEDDDTVAVGIRFANGGTSARPANVIVNGTTVDTVSFEPTGSWSTWSTASVPVSLNDGSNTIRIDPTMATGLPNVDYLDLEAAPEPEPDRFEAEDSPATCDGSIDTNHSGYSGSGFCNGDNAVGAAAQFTVTPADAGTATVEVRFANGASYGNARPANVIVNGTTVDTVSFESTGTWSAWVTKTLTMSLNAGSNTIRLDPTTTAGLPNVDYIEVGPNA
ncbi:cellulase family glycosylhydrolase [Streptomyces sp. TRM68367]|uniref:cellulase family glycosylhydrolase n=1 Tax=Streptomyces sp. TRM68367 TaxID=2758415 RepID=UPI0029351326|nr:cellulase family glycosylhydrolase [Streptomyces sp. TRM68367]